MGRSGRGRRGAAATVTLALVCAALVACGRQTSAPSRPGGGRDLAPTHGPRFVSPDEAASAWHLTVPRCEGVEYYNRPTGGQAAYGHASPNTIIIQPVARSRFRPDREIAGLDVENFVVHSLPALGYEYRGTPSPISADEVAGPPIWKSYVEWNEGLSYVQIGSDTMSLDELKAYASRCAMRAPG